MIILKKSICIEPRELRRILIQTKDIFSSKLFIYDVLNSKQAENLVDILFEFILKFVADPKHIRSLRIIDQESIKQRLTRIFQKEYDYTSNIKSKYFISSPFKVAFRIPTFKEWKYYCLQDQDLMPDPSSLKIFSHSVIPKFKNPLVKSPEKRTIQTQTILLHGKRHRFLKNSLSPRKRHRSPPNRKHQEIPNLFLL